MEKECIQNAVDTFDKFIGNAIVSILEVEELRAQFISDTDEETKKGMRLLERAYYYDGPPKALYITIPSLPISFNKALKSCFARDKNVYTSLKKWWDIKIKNACENMICIDKDKPFTQFTKAAAFVKFTFNKKILRDIDNYAVKFIVDALENNNIISDDNSSILELLVPMFDTGKDQGIEIIVTESNDILQKVSEIYSKLKDIFIHWKESGNIYVNHSEFFDVN